MATYEIRRGMDIPLPGAPARRVETVLPPAHARIVLGEWAYLKLRPLVKVGDAVRKNSPLLYSKRWPALRFRSPYAGIVEEIRTGERRVLQEIRLRLSDASAEEPVRAYESAQIAQLARSEVLSGLLDSGLFMLLRQRPFSKVPDPEAEPKCIFVNAMNTAPFLPDAALAVREHEEAFQAGLDAMTRLTRGCVHLCLPGDRQDLPSALTKARNVEVHQFKGPHPAGNTSVHIHHISPIRPGDVVWVIKAVDLIPIGRLFLEGKMPADRLVSLAGPGVREAARCHYRLGVGMPLEEWLRDKLLGGEQRVIAGDVLAGTRRNADDCVRLDDVAFCVLPEGRDREFMGWLAPGIRSFSWSRSFVSWWLRPSSYIWSTNQRGCRRPMILTGVYERFLPMRILPEFLIRAILANDWAEAVKLGLLETDPEDFALCAFACPSKMDLVDIVRAGLEQVEREGIPT